MAVCVISAVLDTDTGVMRAACQVHCSFALPCAHDGEPASAVPMHTDSSPSRDEAIKHWRARTRGQRHLVIHQGRFGARRHQIDDTLPASCWCDVEVIAAQEIM